MQYKDVQNIAKMTIQFIKENIQPGMTLSVSGKEYTTSERVIAENDIITIDLSPQNGDIWGDYARTIIIENGKVVEIDNVSNEEWKKGLLMEKFLHEEMCKFVTPKTTFEELYYYINSIIEEKGVTIQHPV